MSECPECGRVQDAFERKRDVYEFECPQGHEWVQAIEGTTDE